MATIQDLHDLVSANETQQGSSDKITGAEVRAVDNAIIDELARGLITTTDFDTLFPIPITESKNVIILTNGESGGEPGIWTLVANIGQTPDGQTYMASNDPNFVWQHVADYRTNDQLKQIFTASEGLVYDSGHTYLGHNADGDTFTALLTSNRQINTDAFSLTLQGATTHFTRFGDGFIQFHGRIIQLDNSIENLFNAKISIGGAGSQSSALLEMTSTSQGFLRPRMTRTQRDAIVSPATGLSIYQTDNLPGHYFYNGASWSAENPTRYTPTGLNDAVGVPGQITSDANNVYVKTNAGWKFIAMTAMSP